MPKLKNSNETFLGLSKIREKSIEKYVCSLRSYYCISLTSKAIFGSKDPKGREFDDESLMAAQSG